MPEQKKHLFDNPKNVKRVLYLLYICCAGLVVTDYFYHRHVIHAWENIFGFYALYGFVACVILVLLATQMRKLVMRKEDYYLEKENVDD